MKELEKLKIGCNRLIIIESLQNEEEHTGKNLYNDLKSIEYQPLQIDYYSISNKKLLFECLERIQDITCDWSKPIIHIEVHGDKDGFVLFDKNNSMEFVSWKEIIPSLTSINYNSKNSLIITLGVCYGAYIGLEVINEFVLFRRAPFLLMIGPPSKILNTEIEIGFKYFYRNIMKTKDISSAFNILQNAKIQILKTAPVFAIDFIHKMKNVLKENEPSKELIDKFNINKENYINYLNAKEYRLEQAKKILKLNYLKFLMIDTYPELEGEFLLFDEIWIN